MSADRSGTAVLMFGCYRSRTKPCVLSHKVALGVDAGNLTGAVFARLPSNASSMGGRRTRSVICKAAIPDHSGAAVSPMFGCYESHDTLCSLAQSGSRRRCMCGTSFATGAVFAPLCSNASSMHPCWSLPQWSTQL